MIAPDFRNTEAMSLVGPAQTFISANYGMYLLSRVRPVRKSNLS